MYVSRKTDFFGARLIPFGLRRGGIFTRTKSKGIYLRRRSRRLRGKGRETVNGKGGGTGGKGQTFPHARNLRRIGAQSGDSHRPSRGGGVQAQRKGGRGGNGTGGKISPLSRRRGDGDKREDHDGQHADKNSFRGRLPCGGLRKYRFPDDQLSFLERGRNRGRGNFQLSARNSEFSLSPRGNSPQRHGGSITYS